MVPHCKVVEISTANLSQSGAAFSRCEFLGGSVIYENASAVGLEPTTSGLGNLRSILMSYAECEKLDTMRNLQKKVYTCLYFLSGIKD